MKPFTVKKQQSIKDNLDLLQDKGLFDPDDMPSLFGDNTVWQNNNEVYFYSDVDTKACLDLIKGVRAAEKYAMKHAIDLGLEIGTIPVVIRINSYGGSVHDGFAAMDIIKACKVPVHTIVEGVAASAATFISTAGTHRFITPNSFMLIHQLSSSMWGKFDEMEDEIINLKLIMESIRKVYETTTKLKKADIKELLKKDMWWNAEKCVEVGLVHSIKL